MHFGKNIGHQMPKTTSRRAKPVAIVAISSAIFLGLIAVLLLGNKSPISGQDVNIQNDSMQADTAEPEVAKVDEAVQKLQLMRNNFVSEHIVCGIGIGESANEESANTMSIEESRVALRNYLSGILERLADKNFANVNASSKRSWIDSTMYSGLIF